MADKSCIVVNKLSEDLEAENELFEEDYLTVLSAVSCFMIRDLNRIKGYFEVTVPAYAPSEFRSHFRMTRGTCEFLCREIINTGRIPTGSSRGRHPIPPVKQVLVLLWSLANQEPARLIADRFDITISSVDRVLQRGTQALADLSAEYIKWANGKCFFFHNIHFRCKAFYLFSSTSAFLMILFLLLFIIN